MTDEQLYAGYGPVMYSLYECRGSWKTRGRVAECRRAEKRVEQISRSQNRDQTRSEQRRVLGTNETQQTKAERKDRRQRLVQILQNAGTREQNDNAGKTQTRIERKTQTERQRQRERDRERKRQRERDRQTERQTERQRETHRERQRQRERERRRRMREMCVHINVCTDTSTQQVMKKDEFSVRVR